MDSFGTYQKLGLRTLIVFIIENCGPAFFITIIWLILIGFKTLGVEMLASFFSSSPDAPASISNILDFGILGGIAVIIIAVGFAVVWASIDYFTYYFVLDENSLRIKRGLLNKDEISIPYRQIQDVDIEQTLMQQIFGVARLAVLTAGHGGLEIGDEKDDSEIALPIIDKKRAEAIREELIRHSNVEKVVTVNPTTTQPHVTPSL